MNCTLCLSLKTKIFEEKYLHCENCDLIFMSHLFRLDTLSEFERYMRHENVVTEPGYQDFVQPLVQSILKEVPADSLGLDFGSGTDSAAGHMLREKGFKVDRYDPYFHPDAAALEKKYDFVLACEVIEHFYHPSNSFEVIKNLLKPGGTFFAMTSIYDSSIDFKSWYYRRDETHVSFYSAKTFEWIQERFKFKALTIASKSLVVFKA